MPAPTQSKILAINYYTCRRRFAAAFAFGSGTFFETITPGTGEFNDLGIAGVLPDDRAGDLQAVFVRLATDPSTYAAEANLKKMISDVEALRSMLVKVYVNRAEICRIPIWGCGHPPSWQQGQASLTANTASTVVQNGGYMLQFVSHEVLAKQSVRVELVSNLAYALQLQQDIDVTLQFADRRRA